MKAKIKTLEPTFGKAVEEYVSKTVAYNSLCETDQTPHHLVCEVHFMNKLHELWFEIPENPIDVPMRFQTAIIKQGVYDIVSTKDNETFVAYEGNIIKMDDIPFIIKAKVYGTAEEHQEYVQNSGISKHRIIEDLLNFIFTGKPPKQ